MRFRTRGAGVFYVIIAEFHFCNLVWKVLTTSLNGVHRLEDKETSIPINSLKKGCKNQQNCK